VNYLILQRKVEEAKCNEFVHVEFTALTLITKRHPMISLVIWTRGKETIVLGVKHTALVTDRVIWVLSYDYPIFLL
jgi:hypothetical protein